MAAVAVGDGGVILIGAAPPGNGLLRVFLFQNGFVEEQAGNVSDLVDEDAFSC